METLLEMAGGERLVLLFVDESVEREAELDGIFLKLDRELVHGGLEREETGDSSRAAHGRRSTDVAADQSGRDL